MNIKIYLYKEKSMDKYYVVENKNIGAVGNPMITEAVIFTGTKSECLQYEEVKRREYKDRTMGDCFTISEKEYKKLEERKQFWDSLSPEEKKEVIDVNGKKYNKSLYKRNEK